MVQTRLSLLPLFCCLGNQMHRRWLSVLLQSYCLKVCSSKNIVLLYSGTSLKGYFAF